MVIITYDGNSFANLQWVGLDTYPTGTYGYGERATNSGSALIGLLIDDIQFYAKQGSSAGSGNMLAVLKNSSGVTLHTFWTQAGTALDASGAWTAFTSTPYTTAVAEGDYFSCETSASGDIGQVGRNNSTTIDKYDTTQSTGVTYLPQSNQEKDCYFKITTSEPASDTVLLPPPPAMVRL